MRLSIVAFLPRLSQDSMYPIQSHYQYHLKPDIMHRNLPYSFLYDGILRHSADTGMRHLPLNSVQPSIVRRSQVTYHNVANL